jgi:hypothetical protein
MAKWASANGSNVLTGLNIDSVTYQSGVVDRYFFSGSPDLSGVVAGFQLTVSGCTNPENDGTFLIFARDNTAKTIDVINTAISDASFNETSSPGTAIVKQNAAVIQEPTAAKQTAGFLDGERPPAGWLNWILNQAGAVQSDLTEVGYSTVASATYVALGGEGITVAPTYSTTAWGSTVGASSATDVTGSTITPKTTAGSRVLVGSICSVDYASADGNGRLALAINGTTLTGANQLWLPTENTAMANMHLITSATGGTESYKQQAYTSGGTTNIVTTNGRTWAAEFASSVAAGSATKAGTQNSTLTNTYEDLTSLSITISPTNNPVLLLFAGNFQLGAAGYTTGFRFTDGTNNYGEWLYRNDPGAASAFGGSTAWLTGELNGSKTFKCQFKSLTADIVTMNTCSFHAIEIAGAVERATPAGACSVTTSEATLTDGSTALSKTFTPASAGKYLAVLTGYTQRTGGAGYVTFKVKQGSTTLVTIDHARDSAADYKSPVTIIVPTGRLTAGTPYTVSATAQTSAGTYTFTGSALFLIEVPEVTAGFSGDAAEATLTDVKPGQTEVEFNSQYLCSTDDALSIQLLENVNSGGATQVKEWVLTTPGTKDLPLSLKWRRPTALAAGDDVVYSIQAKKATGNAVFQPGQLIASEVNVI